MTPELPRRAFIVLADRVRVRFTRSERPPFEYAITLEVDTGEEWTTVRLWDNSDGLDQHHEHPYTERDGKHPPIVHAYASANEAMAAAIEAARTDWEAILECWKDTK